MIITTPPAVAIINDAADQSFGCALIERANVYSTSQPRTLCNAVHMRRRAIIKMVMQPRSSHLRNESVYRRNAHSVSVLHATIDVTIG